MKRKIRLQLFAEDAGTADTQTAGEAGSQLATGTTEVSESGDGQVVPGEEPTRSFDDMIKNEYKKDFNAAVSKAVKNRIKDNKVAEGKLNKLIPLVSMLAGRYGIEPGDMTEDILGEIADRALDDNAFYEEGAMEHGVDIDVWKQMQRTQRENEELRRYHAQVMQTQESQQRFMHLNQEAEELRELYPEFDLDEEMSNPEFQRLAWNAGVPLKTAYQVVHNDEIMASGMQVVAKKTAEKLAANIQAGARRASEGAISNPSATISQRKEFSKEELEDIKRRVRSGERVVF